MAPQSSEVRFSSVALAVRGRQLCYSAARGSKIVCMRAETLTDDIVKRPSGLCSKHGYWQPYGTVILVYDVAICPGLYRHQTGAGKAIVLRELGVQVRGSLVGEGRSKVNV